MKKKKKLKPLKNQTAEIPYLDSQLKDLKTINLRNVIKNLKKEEKPNVDIEKW